jgi:signal peptidase I
VGLLWCSATREHWVFERATVRFIRLLGNIALWLGALLGVAAGSMYLADAFDVAQPLIVISGSMEPGIHTGDLLIATKANSADLEVGDVVSLPSDLTQKLVTHRITQIEPAEEGGWKIYMQGDANEFEDIAPYLVGDEVWQPALQIPHVGFVVSKLMQPSVAMPIVIALGALLGMSLLDGGKRPDDDDEVEDEHDDEWDASGHDDPTHEIERPGTHLPLPSVGGNALLEPSLIERSLDDIHVVADHEPLVTSTDSIDDLDRALAALGIDFDGIEQYDSTVDFNRQSLELGLVTESEFTPDPFDRILTG